nr:TIGR03089 family protein [Spelaeicoccus albus]
MTSLTSVDPSNPRLIWYGPQSERIELSGRVLDNWVAKSANFLVDFLDVECGDALTLDLPEHWRTIVLCLAGWSVGATVRLGAEAADDEAGSSSGAVITTDPRRFAGRGDPTAGVALAGLAMRYDGDLPAGVLDYNAEARACGDVFTAFDEPDEAQTAVTDGQSSASYADLAAVTGRSGRTLRQAGRPGTSRVTDVLATLAAGGSITLVDQTRAAEIPQIARAEGIPGPS